MLGLKHRGLTIVWCVLDLSVRQEAAPSRQVGDSVALEQGGDATCEPLHHLPLPSHHLAEVHAQLARLDADFGKMLLRLGELVRGIEQCLGRDATPVQAGAPVGRVALTIKGFVYAGGAQTQLSRSYGGVVARRAGADDDHVVLVIHC